MSANFSFGSAAPRAELALVRQRLRAIQRQCLKLRRQQGIERYRHGWRCSPQDPLCLVVLAYSGGSAEVAADFVVGRGWWKGKQAGGRILADKANVLAAVEAVYDEAPLDLVMSLQRNPVTAGVCSERELVTIVRWLVERSLYDWVEKQNTVQGVAPSRMQLVDKALDCIPPFTPAHLQRIVRSFLTASQRSQRRWLAKFRLRWGLRLGKLKQPCVSGGEADQGRRGTENGCGRQALFWARVASPFFASF